MARRRNSEWIEEAGPIEPGQPRARAADRYEQVYQLRDDWTALFLTALSDGHGGEAIIREHRGTEPRIAVQAKDPATLATIEKEFLRLRAPLAQAIAEAVYNFGKANVPNLPDSQ